MDASQMSRSHPPVPLRLEASSETPGLNGGEEEPPELVTEEPAQMIMCTLRGDWMHRIERPSSSHLMPPVSTAISNDGQRA